ncbi:MAG: acyl-CoA dehydrogenase family protein [Gammaproteobacteria bacterium]
MIPRDVFSEEHEIFRASVRRFVEREIVPYHAAWEADGVVSREVWRAAGEHSLLCPFVPEAYGGAGGDFLHVAVVAEELARVDATGPAFHLHSGIVAPYVLEYGTEAQKQRWLPGMCSGDIIGAIAMSEPAAGSDLAAIRTRAERDGDSYVVNGQKTFISNGQLADLVITACKTDTQAGARGISLLLVDTATPGFSRGRNLDKIGWKAQDTSELFYDDVRVDADALLGAENRGFHQLMQQLAQERLIVALRSAVTMEAALAWTLDYTRGREAFGRPLAEFQNTRFKLAEVKARAVVTRTFIDRCLALHMAGQLDATDAAIAKLHATETLMAVRDDCLQLHGGFGYIGEFSIARAWAGHRVSRIAGGSSEIMKEIIARAL